MNICPQEQGSQGEPLFLEVSTTLKAMSKPNIVCIGGRYGLGSKEFTPNMVLSVYENLKKAPVVIQVSDSVRFLLGEWHH